MKDAIKRRSAYMKRNSNVTLEIGSSIYPRFRLNIPVDMGLYEDDIIWYSTHDELYIGPSLDNAKIVSSRFKCEDFAKKVVSDVFNVSNRNTLTADTVLAMMKDMNGIRAVDVYNNEDVVLYTEAYHRILKFMKGLSKSRIQYYLKPGQFPKCKDRYMLPVFVANFQKSVIRYCDDPYIESYTKMRRSISIDIDTSYMKEDFLRYNLVYPVSLIRGYIDNRDVVTVNGEDNIQPPSR